MLCSTNDPAAEWVVTDICSGLVSSRPQPTRTLRPTPTSRPTNACARCPPLQQVVQVASSHPSTRYVSFLTNKADFCPRMLHQRYMTRTKLNIGNQAFSVAFPLSVKTPNNILKLLFHLHFSGVICPLTIPGS